MRFLKLAYVKIVRTEIGRIPTIDEFSMILASINATDEDFTTGHFRPGSGGESAFYKLLTGEVIINDLKEV